MKYAYLFEARGIQRFLFASGKLRDMLGGSELVDYICADGGFLDHVLDALDLAPTVVRKAGGVFYLVFDTAEEAQRLQAAWRLATAQWLPGLERVDGLAGGASVREAVRNGIDALHRQRNIVQPELPRPGPFSGRSPRTGLAAVARDGGESLDAATQAMRRFVRPKGSLSLTARFLDREGLHWPRNFEADARPQERFPLGERRMVGLLHADGNGLGEVLRVLDAACTDADDGVYAKIYRCFSDGLTVSTLAAASEATEKVLLPAAEKNVMPARPLVLGGDDLSMVLRADLALPYTEVFLRAFEAKTASAMRELRAVFDASGLAAQSSQLPAALTACAGITYMKCSQPFQSAYDIAEGLCKRAKDASRRAAPGGKMPSSIAFLRVQDSLLEDADSLFEQMFCINTAAAQNQRMQMALTAYALAPGNGLPCLGDLYRMRDVFDGRQQEQGSGGKLRSMNDRPLRELATLLHVDLAQARQAYARWRQVSQRNQPEALLEFDNALQALVADPLEDLPFGCSERASPLDDLLSLLTIRSFSGQRVAA